MQFVDILNDVYDRTGQSQSTSVPAEVSRRIKRYVNRWNRIVLARPGMEALRRTYGVTKASVASQPTYGVQMKSIQWMVEATTQRRIWPQTLGWYRDRYPAPLIFTGTPTNYIPLGDARIHTLPSAACELFIVSTSAADTTGIVKVEAIRSNGYRVSLSHVLTGLTPVSLSATITDVVDIQDVRVSAAQAGDVTLTQGSGGTELSRIVIGQTSARFLRFALAPTPSQAITYTLDGIADIVDLTYDYDEPFASPDFHDILVDGAVYEEWSARGRGGEARMLLDGGNPQNPPASSIEGRIKALRDSLMEWPEPSDRRAFRAFDETIHLPLA